MSQAVGTHDSTPGEDFIAGLKKEIEAVHYNYEKYKNARPSSRTSSPASFVEEDHGTIPLSYSNLLMLKLILFNIRSSKKRIEEQRSYRSATRKKYPEAQITTSSKISPAGNRNSSKRDEMNTFFPLTFVFNHSIGYVRWSLFGWPRTLPSTNHQLRN